MSNYEIPDGAIRWLRSGERGLSAQTIFARMTGLPISGRDVDHPWDPHDVGRCRKLLACVPEFAARLHEMADVSPKWAALIEHWDQICALMDRDALMGKFSDEAYAMMTRILHYSNLPDAASSSDAAGRTA